MKISEILVFDSVSIYVKLKTQYHGKDLPSSCLMQWKIRMFCCIFKNLVKDVTFVVSLVSGLAILTISLNEGIKFTYYHTLNWGKSLGIYPYPNLMNENCIESIMSNLYQKIIS